jgi:hypothetical protein
MSLIFEAIIFSDRGCQERRFVCSICGLDSEVERLKTKLSSCERPAVLFLDSFLESNRRVLVLIYGVLFCSFSRSFLCDSCFEVFRNFCLSMPW